MMHNFIQDIFGKDHDEINLTDIKAFFEEEREETAILEFKSGEVEIEDIFKEVAALLNTEGGLIIVGTPREVKKQKGKKKFNTCQGELMYSKFRSKDWLFQKIASNISPVPTNLLIKEISGEEGTVFLINVPQSKRPPHQANSDGRYYLRLECEAKPAPHGLVQALFDKRRVPDLTARLEIIRSVKGTTQLTVFIRNQSEIPADKVSFLIDVYNVNDIESKWHFDEVDDFLGRKFSMSSSAGQVLVQVISTSIKFTVDHQNDEFLVMAGFWSLQNDFDLKFWTVDPKSSKIVNEGAFDSELTLTEALKKLKRLST